MLWGVMGRVVGWIMGIVRMCLASIVREYESWRGEVSNNVYMRILVAVCDAGDWKLHPT